MSTFCLCPYVPHIVHIRHVRVPQPYHLYYTIGHNISLIKPNKSVPLNIHTKGIGLPPPIPCISPYISVIQHCPQVFAALFPVHRIKITGLWIFSWPPSLSSLFISDTVIQWYTVIQGRHRQWGHNSLLSLSCLIIPTSSQSKSLSFF